MRCKQSANPNRYGSEEELSGPQRPLAVRSYHGHIEFKGLFEIYWIDGDDIELLEGYDK